MIWRASRFDYNIKNSWIFVGCWEEKRWEFSRSESYGACVGYWGEMHALEFIGRRILLGDVFSIKKAHRLLLRWECLDWASKSKTWCNKVKRDCPFIIPLVYWHWFEHSTHIYYCGPSFFMCAPTILARLIFYFILIEKLYFIKIWSSHLFLFF